MPGKLDITVGPMFSGKTTRLAEIYEKSQKDGHDAVIINYIGDTRYGDEGMTTHDGITFPCIMAETLTEVWSAREQILYEKVCAHHLQLHYAKIIIINEAQFFTDLFPVVLAMVQDGKDVYVAGLDGDYKKQKFGSILDLVPHCDNITKLRATCFRCANPAPFTKRITEDTEQLLISVVGYKAMCRTCYEQA